VFRRFNTYCYTDTQPLNSRIQSNKYTGVPDLICSSRSTKTCRGLCNMTTWSKKRGFGIRRVTNSLPGLISSIIRESFSFKIFGAKTSNPKHSFAIFGAKILYENCARKMLMKLIPGILSVMVRFYYFLYVFLWRWKTALYISTC